MNNLDPGLNPILCDSTKEECCDILHIVDSTLSNTQRHSTLFTQERFKHLDTALACLKVDDWRIKERIKTVFVGIVICLNIGVDPPDVIRTSVSACLECWVDPIPIPPQKALEAIGKAMQMQYERWQPRAHYKVCLDPTADAVKKLCLTMRRNAKDERVLFHYNGHGVPKPTDNGEIWVFNKDFTQYIPLSIYSIQKWLAGSTICVFDCNRAAIMVSWFLRFYDARRYERKQAILNVSGEGNPYNLSHIVEDHILFAACGENEMLPINPELPADVFTSCLTTPIKIALKWFASRTIISGITQASVDQIPGRLNDRRTPLGELNWIFTAVTDTIAWTVLPKHLFQKLFRQDLMVASLFRNFFLAERLLRSCKCTPVSYPKLPPTYSHPMWLAWDCAADCCLAQLPKLIKDPNAEYKHSTFFYEQLTAFEVWLEFGTEDKEPSEQLPVVLQVLLSQQHRMRALVLLSKFLDLGPWAVNQALNVGIYPYILKLLQSLAPVLRDIMVFIWTKILAIDKSCQLELIKENGYIYFINILSNVTHPTSQRSQAAFVISVICNDFPSGQLVCLNAKIIPICLSQILDPDPLLRRCIVFLLARLWENCEEAKEVAIKELAYEKLFQLLSDHVPEVRAAAVYALGTFIVQKESLLNEALSNITFKLSLTLPVVTFDSSPMVRKELVITLAHLVNAYYSHLVEYIRRQLTSSKYGPESGTSFSYLHDTPLTHLNNASNTSLRSVSQTTIPPLIVEKESSKSLPITDLSLQNNFADDHNNCTLNEDQSGIFDFIYKVLHSLATDPFPTVAHLAQLILQHLHASAIQSCSSNASSSTNEPLTSKKSQLIPKQLVTPLSPIRSLTSLNSSTTSITPPPFSIPVNDSTLPSTQDPFPKLKTSSLANNSTADSLNNTIHNTPSSGSSYIASLTRKFPRAQNIANVFKWRSDGATPGTETSEDQSFTQMPLLSNKAFVSRLYDQLCLYFSSPLMNQNQDVEKSSDYSQRLWRMQRNDYIIGETQDALQPPNKLTFCRFSNEIALFDNDASVVRSIVFHPFEPILCISDDDRGITVCNWEDGVKLNYITNHRKNAIISSLALLNTHDLTLIAAGSEDGVVSIWNGLCSESRLIVSWRALCDLSSLPSEHCPNTVLEWNEHSPYLFASGNVNVIRVWDLNRELCVQDISTHSDSPVTCMVNDKGQSDNLLSVGYKDGQIRLYDLRQSAKSSAICVYDEHERHPVLKVFMPKSANGDLISASSNGLVKFWDLRVSTGSIKNFEVAASSSTVTSFAVYDQAPIMAVGMQDSRVKVMNFNCDDLSVIRHHDGFLAHRIGPISYLTFHPYYTLLAVGATDSLVSVYGTDVLKS